MHRRYRKLAVLEAYGDLTDSERTRLHTHIANCPTCAAWQISTSTLAGTRGRLLPILPAGLKDRIIRGVRHAEQHAGEHAEKHPVQQEGRGPRSAIRWTRIPRFVLAPASVLLLVGIGYLVGRLTAPETPPSQAAQESALPIAAPLATSPAVTPTHPAPHPVGRDTGRPDRVSAYLDRSHALLVGIMNGPAPQAQAYFTSLTAEREASRRLVGEARSLRGELDRPEDARAKKLIEELELILLQIANLDRKHAPVGIRIVREGVDSQSIILRIIIERMALHERESAAPSRGSGVNS